MSPSFRYKAISAQGENVEGSLDAESQEEVVEKLFEQELTPLDISANRSHWFPRNKTANTDAPSSINLKLTPRHILDFTRSCANLMKSGFAIDKAIYTVGKTASSSKKSIIQQLCQNLFQSLEEGLSLSQALAKSSSQFSALYISLVTAGEESGQLSFVFQKLSEFLQEQQEFRKTIQGIMLYPLIVITISLLSIIVMLGFVIPRFVGIFEDLGQSLPYLTQVMISLSNFFRAHVLLIMIVMGLGFSILRIGMARKKIRAKIDYLLLITPLFGPLIQRIMIARFSSTLSMLLEGGLKIVPALKFAQMTVSNIYIANAIHQLREDVTRGTYLHISMQDNPTAFPPLLIHMLAVGEETGNIEGSLVHISETYEEEVRSALKTFTTVLSPLLILIMGLGVALIIASMLLPILQVTDIDF